MILSKNSHIVATVKKRLKMAFRKDNKCLTIMDFCGLMVFTHQIVILTKRYKK